MLIKKYGTAFVLTILLCFILFTQEVSAGHKHNDSCYTTIYHKHTSGCYNTTYHVHSGTETANGGCYTQAIICNNTLTEMMETYSATCGLPTTLSDYGTLYVAMGGGTYVPNGEGYRGREVQR